MTYLLLDTINFARSGICPSEVVKCQAATCLQGERILHGAEDIARAWKCKGH
jgi:hypothetical protein